MINVEYDRKICAWLDANKEQIVQDWMDLVRIPSVQGVAAPRAPFGVECDRALNAAAEKFAQRKFEVRVENERGYALAFGGEGETTIGIFGHSDVVPVGDGWLYAKPFEPIVKEGFLIGRGASDNKSGIMAAMCVMELLRDCKIPMKSRLQTFVGTNEESGMADVENFVAYEKMPDLSLIPDGGFACSLGEKGILRMWAKCGRAFKTIRAFSGGSAFNVVLDRVDVTIDANADLVQELKNKTAGEDAFLLTVDADGTIHLQATGMAKHAASPDGGVNATVLAAELLLSCTCLDCGDRAILKDVYRALHSFWGEGLDIQFADELFGKLTSVNGMVKTEDQKLCVSLDIRYGTALAATELEKRLQNAWTNLGWEIVYLYNRAGFSVDPASPIPHIFEELCRDVTGREYKTYRMSGGTYARYLKNAFTIGSCVTDAAREPKLTFPEGHGGAHMKDEAIELEGFFQAVRILAHGVIACDRELNR